MQRSPLQRGGGDTLLEDNLKNMREALTFQTTELAVTNSLAGVPVPAEYQKTTTFISPGKATALNLPSEDAKAPIDALCAYKSPFQHYLTLDVIN
jgi:hypothetical protein